jgi:hypothetical protein
MRSWRRFIACSPKAETVSLCADPAKVSIQHA